MNTLSNVEAALLGLLRNGPMYPYQIEKEVQERDMRFWTELSMSSIYKLLRKLERTNIVISKTEISDENRTRKRYELTEEGRKALENKVKELVSEPDHIRWQVDIGISNLDMLPLDEAVLCLDKYKAKLEQSIEQYRGLAKYMSEAGCTRRAQGLASRPQYLMEGEIRWIDSYLKQIIE